MSKVLITTVPFGDKDRRPVDLLNESGVDYSINPLGRKLQPHELATMVADVEVIIAGTELITSEVIDNAPKLKLISRVGVGLDGVDLNYAKSKGIKVSYTADAPGPAVSELTIGLMLSLLRCIHVSNAQMHQGGWHRFFGRRLSEVDVGIIGVGRIGKRVLRHLSGFGVRQVFINDINPDYSFEAELGIKLNWVEKEKIYSDCDLISISTPLTESTKNMIRLDHLRRMKPDVLLVNTARGGIINEEDLYTVLKEGRLGGVALDVFQNEPYDGPLKEIERCILTSHMGSMSVDCRSRMELEATEEALRFIQGMPLQNLVPDYEYKHREY